MPTQATVPRYKVLCSPILESFKAHPILTSKFLLRSNSYQRAVRNYDNSVKSKASTDKISFYKNLVEETRLNAYYSADKLKLRLGNEHYAALKQALAERAEKPGKIAALADKHADNVMMVSIGILGASMASVVGLALYRLPKAFGAIGENSQKVFEDTQRLLTVIASNLVPLGIALVVITAVMIVNASTKLVQDAANLFKVKNGNT
ncbi:MAG: hypothetical protein N3G22_04115 [Candidatus Micrarchaeota archaeon]|nr:hypothetical protein [Candidatus Micrarchaeota archaeon]